MKESVVSFEEKKQHNLGLPSFKLPARSKMYIKTNPLNINLTSSVYGY